MNIVILLGSNRKIGKSQEIEAMLSRVDSKHTIDVIRMADATIESCLACDLCAQRGACHLEEDFEAIYLKLIDADALFIIVPVYASIPSKLTALFERLTSLMFSTGIMNSERNPLLGKPTAIFYYCSSGIADETPLKLIFQKFLMVGYDFFNVNYNFLNDCPDADERYGRDVCRYVQDVLLSL